MNTEAIAHYHQVLEQSLHESHEQMMSELEKRHLFFGKLPVCRVLRPHFYGKTQWEYLSRRTQLILNAFSKAHQAALQDDEIRAQLDLEAFEEALFSVDLATGIKIPWSSSRLDAFYHPETGYLRFVEYNAETPAGIGYGDQLTEMFLSLPVMKDFQETYRVAKTWGLPQLLGVVLRGYRDWGGRELTPNIAIVDWQDVPTLNEHTITAEYFERHGCKSVLCDPRDLEYRDGKVWYKNFRVDIIYKRVLISEMVKRMGVDAELVKAIKERAVFMTNSFSAKLMAKKASLALLSDEQNQQLFSIEERAAIQAHIPWTRRVQDRETFHNGERIDLLSYISNNRDNLVIKPNDEYGGSGVVIGWECDQEEWDKTIQHALTEPHVVQEKVTIIEREFPIMLDGDLKILPLYLDANPYVFYGEEVGGCLTRLSSAALLNVTAGSGSVVPMFVIEKR